jgi:hypothetical protein
VEADGLTFLADSAMAEEITKDSRFSYFTGRPRKPADEQLEARVGIEPAYTALQAAA